MKGFMIQKIILTLIFVISCSTPCCNAGNRADSLRSIILDGGKHDYVMVFAHRGDWRNAPAENSLASYQRCIDIGVDGIEVDVQMTKDSILVVMHDETLDRTTTGSGKVSDYTYNELKDLYLRSPIGVVTKERVPTFKQVLKLAKGKILIQVDKWPKIKDLVLKEAKEEDCLSQIILRSSWSGKVFKTKVGQLPKEVIYIPVLVCNGKDDLQKLADLQSAFSTPIVSFSFKKDDYPILENITKLKEKGNRIWLNSLWDKFNGGHDDELAMKDEDNSYGWLIRKGANIIFSDNPSRLLSYLYKNNKRTIK